MAGEGDRLARGAVRANFGPLNVSKERWDSIFNSEQEEVKLEEVKPEQEKQPVHVYVGIGGRR